MSGLSYDPETFELLSVAGDCTLSVYDIRMKEALSRSDEQESELTCVERIKAGKKVICGTQDGVLLVFSRGRWGDCTDRSYTPIFDLMCCVS